MTELILPWFSAIEILVTKWLTPIIVIGVLVFIHELGHFLLAKFCGVGVVKFSVGFGPAIFKFRHKETVYQLSIIPLGGYVRMVGDMPDMITGPQITDQAVREEDKLDDDTLEAHLGVKLNPELRAALADKNQWFIEKNYWQKSAIVFAGPFFNFILAIFLVFTSVVLYGQEDVNELSIIGSVFKGSPADKAGIKQGDLVFKVNNQEVKKWIDLANTIHSSEGKEVSLSVRRASSILDLVVTPQVQQRKTNDGKEAKVYLIGIGPQTTRIETDFFSAISIGFSWTYVSTKMTIEGLLGMFSGKVSKDDLAGPLFIFQEVGHRAEKGLESVIHLTALLSVSLAVLNLLPIPVLDGGHLLFFFIEAILGPMSIRKKEIAQSIGLLFLLGIMVFAVSNDLTREPVSNEPKWENAEK